MLSCIPFSVASYSFAPLRIIRIMRIAFIGIKGLPSKGGAERVVEAIAEGLAGKHEITVYCNSPYRGRSC